MRRSTSILSALVALLVAHAPARASADVAGVEFFETKIRPVLAEQCFGCHSASAEKLKAKLLLDTRDGILKGGESEAPAIVPGKTDEGTLLNAIKWENDELRMPPKKKLADAVVADFEAWVKMGAPMPAAVNPATAPAAKKLEGLTIEDGRKFWSFIPPREPKFPASTQPAEAIKNEIDAFVVAKLAENGLARSPRAEKRTLIRRATYDLTGLPPTAAEVDAFEKDQSEGAYEKLIDRLLASPRYGERWGRFWLDVARYADTKGYVFEEERRYPFSYTYRDWVVRSLNEDLPYDQFLIQQIAADRIVKEDKRPLAALGFLTLGRRFLNNPHDIIDDRIDVVTRGTMALTVACARCHDHKYDPIPTSDYYSLYGVFASTREPETLPLLGGEPPEKVKEYEAELAKRQAELEAYTKSVHENLFKVLREKRQVARYLVAAQKGAGPQPLPEFEINDGVSLVPLVTKRWEDFLKAQAEKNDEVFAVWRKFLTLPTSEFAAKSPQLTKELSRTPSVNPLVARFVISGEAPKSIQDVAERYGRLLATFASLDQPQPDAAVESVRLVLRGDDTPTDIDRKLLGRVLNTAEQQHRRALRRNVDELTATHPGSPQRAMAVEDAPAPVEPTIFVRGNPGSPGKAVPRQFPTVLAPEKREPFKDGSGRLELARAIASKDNPLTARVMVNRVWAYHFGGAGLVRTPSDFGTRGAPPTHPELLDWLALRFVNDDGWSLKKLHKRILLSAAYQQSSRDANPVARMKDPENKLIWRQNPRRLDFEAMRDSLLAASGALDLKLGGRPVDILVQPFSGRRSIYAFIDRQNLPGMFRTFDFASPDTTSGQRFNTSVPQQALFMMNSPFVVEQAKKLAARKDVCDVADPSGRAKELYRWVLARPPAEDELKLAVAFVNGEDAQPRTDLADKPSTWKYGFGEFDEAAQQLKAFYPLSHFTGSAWQGGPTLPDGGTGWAMLTASGGHAGNDHAHAVVRRWIAPRDVTVSIEGELSQNSKDGDGVRARIATPRDGLLASWNVVRKQAETRMGGVALKAGDAIDFIVDCGRAGRVDFDSFEWKVRIKSESPTPAEKGAESSWDSVAQFAGPAPKPPPPLTAWEKFAQVLLESNEFAFVD